MAINPLKEKARTLSLQKISLERTYPKLIERIDILNGVLICVLNIKPTKFSSKYKVKIHYKFSDGYPKVWLIEPKLDFFEGKRPHHLYEDDADGNPRLCVYYPKFKEWKPTMDIAQSFIPWIITWLYTYEYWLVTGEWLYEESPRKSGNI